MTDTVVPFGRRKGMPPAPAPAAPASRARELAAAQADDQRRRYSAAVSMQETERLLREGRPVPARITMALDLRGLDGPEVDTACGAAEPAVDLWECGVEVPTADQVRLLAALTGFPVRYFYMPVKPGFQLDGVIICWGGRRGCQRLEPDYIDERGVLHYGGEPPRTPPAALF